MILRRRGILKQATAFLARTEWPLIPAAALLIGVGLFVVGVGIGFVQVLRWGSLDFGPQDATEVVRIAIPSALGIMLGFQTVMMSFFSGVLSTPRREVRPDAVIES